MAVVQWWQIVMALLGAALSFVSVAYWTRVTRREKEHERIQEHNQVMQERAEMQRSDLSNRLYTLEKSYAILNQQVVPISTALQAILVKELTHYHTPIMDALLTRIGPPS